MTVKQDFLEHEEDVGMGPNRDQPNSEPPDPFDPARLRLSQNFGASLGVQKAILTIPVRKPSKEHFVRTRTEEMYRIETAVVELKEDREIYLVEPSLWPELSTESTFSPRLLETAITRQGVLFLWPMRLPDSNGRIDGWNQSLIDAAELARSKWVRVQANMDLGAYDVSYALGNLPEPEWPDMGMGDLLRIAFRDKFINSRDHPVLRRLRGET